MFVSGLAPFIGAKCLGTTQMECLLTASAAIVRMINIGTYIYIYICMYIYIYIYVCVCVCLGSHTPPHRIVQTAGNHSNTAPAGIAALTKHERAGRNVVMSKCLPWCTCITACRVAELKWRWKIFLCARSAPGGCFGPTKQEEKQAITESLQNCWSCQSVLCILQLH